MWLEGTVVALLDLPAPWDPGVGITPRDQEAPAVKRRR